MREFCRKLGAALTIMFGFIWQEPIDVTLRRLRLLQVGLIISSQFMLYRILDQLKVFDGEHAVMAYATIAGALITQIWSSIGSLHKPIERDE